MILWSVCRLGMPKEALFQVLPCAVGQLHGDCTGKRQCCVGWFGSPPNVVVSGS